MEKQKNTQNLPSNYITLFELQKRWKKQQEDRKQQNEKKQQQEEDHASNDMIHVQAQERKQKKKKKKKKQQEQEQNDRNRQNYPKKHPNFTESSCEACHDEKQNDAVDVVVSVVEGNESEINLKEEAKGNDLGLRKKNKWNQKKRGKVTAREAHAPLKEYISAKTNGNISVKRYEKGKETSPKSTTDEAAVKRYEKEKEKSPKSTTQEAAVHRYEKRKETSPTPTTEEAVLKMYEKRKETSPKPTTEEVVEVKIRAKVEKPSKEEEKNKEKTRSKIVNGRNGVYERYNGIVNRRNFEYLGYHGPYSRNSEYRDYYGSYRAGGPGKVNGRYMVWVKKGEVADDTRD